ncbi:MAG: hypothetical protein AB9866_19075 [Syntrophobacteraceae bacterium]
MTPQEFALHAVKGIKMSFDNGMQNGIDQYLDNRIVDMYTTDEVFEVFTSTEGMTGAKQLSRYETPSILDLQEGFSVQIKENRFGGGILVPEEDYKRWEKDSTLKVDTYLQRKRDALMNDNMFLFLENAFAFLNTAFVNTSYAAPDTVALCGTHSWKTPGASTFTNAGTKKLGTAAINDLHEYAGGFKVADGKYRPLNFDTIVVKMGSENEREAIKLFASDITPTAVGDINIYQGTKTIISTPAITYDNRNFWFARDSRIDNSLKVGVGIYPTLNEPLRESNEAIRTNCTGFYKQGIVNMPFDWFGFDGTVAA